MGIFQKEFDDIEESLETFRAKIYFRSKVESIERIPVTGRMMNLRILLRYQIVKRGKVVAWQQIKSFNLQSTDEEVTR